MRCKDCKWLKISCDCSRYECRLDIEEDELYSVDFIEDIEEEGCRRGEVVGYINMDRADIGVKREGWDEDEEVEVLK